jgi:hypothetical protein
MNRAVKFLKRSSGDQGLLLEASLLLLVSRAVLRLMPFRWIARAVSRSPAARKLDDATARALVERVRWAVRASARNGIGSAVCFPQGIAAQVMLARRGVPSTLHYGVANSPTHALEAHVWVRAGPLDVVGCEGADRFTLLVSFPRGAVSPAR